MRISAFAGRLSASALVLYAAVAFAAQPYPTKPMRLVIPFAPGGIFDYVARLVSPKLTESLGQTVVVDNRTGAGGMIAMSVVNEAAPDGYTILLADPSFVVNPSLHKKTPYAVSAFTPVTVLTTAPLVLTV